MTSIGNYAFSSCSGLTSVISERKTPPALSENAFNGINASCVLYVLTPSVINNYQSWAPYFGGGIVALYEELIDGESYNVSTAIDDVLVVYVRSFNDDVVNHLQSWLIPFDYTITADDVANFDFYKIHFIAAAGMSGEVIDDSDVYLYVKTVGVGETLKGNRPYLVKAKSTVTNYEFLANHVTLLPKQDGILLTTQTTTHSYDFYGTYDTFSATKPYDWMAMSKAGKICWNATAAAQLGSFRWYLKVTAKDGFEDYSKLRISIIDEDNEGEATAVKNVESDACVVSSIYNTSGQKIHEMSHGLNIVKMADGTTRKIFIK